MLTTRRHAGIAVLAATLLAIGGCCAFSPVSAPERPLRLAVYVGDGARGIGVFRWLELTALAKDAETVPVDADTIRGGALDGVDTLIVPGGSSVTMAKTLGAAGRDRIKEFVARGGGYIGTCAGCCLVMAPNKARPVMLGFVPYTFGAAGGGQDRAELNIHFNERAEALAGIKKGNMRIKFSRGPVPVPARTATNDAIEVVATYAGDINAQTDKQRPSKAGQAAALAGTYGKGRVFVFAVHPEMDVDDHSALRGAFRYVTGREVTWTYPQRRRGQLTVGCRCGNKFGIASARFIQRLVRAAEFDVVPVSAATLAEGARRHLDTVIDPATFTDDGTAALASLRRLAAEPAPAPAPFPKKVAKPLRAAIYNDTGGSCFPVAALLALAPEYELTILDAADYRAGALANVDLLVQPGGGCRAQYEHLGPTGVEALRRFVTGGGRYYGICAGAFLASQPYDATKFSRCRVGLVPFRDDEPAHYRGWAPIKVDFTDEGREALGASLTNRTVMYWGGPALIPGKPDADTDVKVFGRYGGRLINTSSADASARARCSSRVRIPRRARPTSTSCAAASASSRASRRARWTPPARATRCPCSSASRRTRSRRSSTSGRSSATGASTCGPPRASTPTTSRISTPSWSPRREKTTTRRASASSSRTADGSWSSPTRTRNAHWPRKSPARSSSIPTPRSSTPCLPTRRVRPRRGRP